MGIRSVQAKHNHAVTTTQIATLILIIHLPEANCSQLFRRQWYRASPNST